MICPGKPRSQLHFTHFTHRRDLADSLGAGVLIFTRKEFEAFGVQHLRYDHYVFARGQYFRPAGSLCGSVLRGASSKLDADSGDEKI